MITMSWKVGQKLVCVRDALPPISQQDLLMTGYVKDQDNGWVTIAYLDAQMIVSRYQKQFEKDGWQAESL
jgi:hypothetical protein